jgi:hypothetical protein
MQLLRLLDTKLFATQVQRGSRDYMAEDVFDIDNERIDRVLSGATGRRSGS